MTPEQIAKYEQAASDGSLPPEENPLSLFAAASTPLLARALAREFNITDLIRLEMSKRGVNEKGQWIGFQAAHEKMLGKRHSGRKSNDG